MKAAERRTRGEGKIVYRRQSAVRRYTFTTIRVGLNSNQPPSRPPRQRPAFSFLRNQHVGASHRLAANAVRRRGPYTTRGKTNSRMAHFRMDNGGIRGQADPLTREI